MGWFSLCAICQTGAMSGQSFFFIIILIPELKRAAGGKPRSFQFKFLPRLKTVVWSLVNDEPSEGSTASAGVVNVNHCHLNTTHEDINQN